MSGSRDGEIDEGCIYVERMGWMGKVGENAIERWAVVRRGKVTG